MSINARYVEFHATQDGNLDLALPGEVDDDIRTSRVLSLWRLDAERDEPPRSLYEKPLGHAYSGQRKPTVGIREGGLRPCRIRDCNLGVSNGFALGVDKPHFDPMRGFFGRRCAKFCGNIATFDPQQIPFDCQFEVQPVAARFDRKRRTNVRRPDSRVVKFDLHGFDIEVLQSEPPIANRRKRQLFAVANRVKRHAALLHCGRLLAFGCPLDRARDHDVAFEAQAAKVGDSVRYAVQGEILRAKPIAGPYGEE